MNKGAYIIATALMLVFIVGLSLFAIRVYDFPLSETLGSVSAEQGDTIRVCENITYGNRERNIFDIYIPANAYKNSENALILFLHGGSWTSGDKSSMAEDCRHFAEHGYVTATMNYSFLNMGGDAVNDFKTMLTEISNALSAIKGYAAAQGVNITKLALSGYSAGAHLAMFYAYAMSQHSPLPVLFVHSKAGPADFRTFSPSSYDVQEFMKNAGLANDEKSVQELVKSEKVVAMIQAVSPVFYVKNGAAPAILSYGRQDSLVVWENAVSMMNVLDTAGVEYTLVEYPNSAHALDKDADSAQRSVDVMFDYAKKYFGY